MTQTLQQLPQPDLQLPRSWWTRYWAMRVAGKVISRIPGYDRNLHRLEVLARRVRRAALIESAYRKNRSRAVGAGAEVSSFDSGYGYSSEQEELAVALMYKGQIASGQYAAAETPETMQAAIERLAEVIAARKPARVVNFGVSYAHVDSVLAERFPDVQFIGIDRSQAVCDLNRADFPRPNMQFIASDIEAWLDEQSDLSDCVFFHVRIAILLPQAFVDQLYRKLIAKRVSAICGFEPVGVSRETNAFVAQTYEPSTSVHFRDTLYIHNFAGLLADRGYRMTHLGYTKTGHPDKDVRLLSFVAVPT
jgi:hypothetical protein